MKINNPAAANVISEDAPVAIAVGDTAVAGTGGEVADEAHRHPVSATQFWTLAGTQDTEATSTSTSTVDLITVGSLEIAVSVPILIVASVRKSSGTNNYYSFGLKVNSTDVWTAGSVSGALTLGTAAALGAAVQIYIPPRKTDYFNNVISNTINLQTASYSAAVPDEEITSLTITYNGGNSDTTGAAVDMYVYIPATT